EAPDFVGTVVRAVPRADAPVIRHYVQTFLIVGGGIDRTDVFARSRLAMLAKHRLRDYLRIINPILELLFRFRIKSFEETLPCFRGGFCDTPGVVTVDPEPVHLATAVDLHLADDRDIVLALARDHASGTTDAAVQIDGHTPL